jgi:putative serine protease PepD
MARRTDAMRLVMAAALGGMVSAAVMVCVGVLSGVGSAAGVGEPAGAGVRAVYRAASPAVVAVQVPGRTGSGFLIDDRGHVVTNAHVVGDATTATVTIGGRDIGARVRGVEGSVDLAVLQLTAPAGDIAPLRFDDAATLRVGDPVVAIGNPFGLQGSLSSGIVSGLRRQIDSPNGFAITGVIQTDAALNPGNSGGPLLDIEGRVVGMATQIATESGRNEGIGFAIPAAVVERTADALIATGHASLAYLGVAGADTGAGVLLGAVMEGGPAVGALRAGDVIVAIDGAPVMSNAALAAALASRVPGDDVEVGVLRDGRRADVAVTLAPRPADGP